MSYRDHVLHWLEEIHYVTRLQQYCSLPSRSLYQEEVRVTAEFLSKRLEELGFEVRVFETEHNPVVFAQRKALSEDAPTVLIYGHYDTQDEGDLELWDTNPFEPVVANGKLFGRGSADNKGQHFAQLLAIEYWLDQEPELLDRVTVKIVLDGDEELGSPTLEQVILSHKQVFQADFVYVSDGPSLSMEAPTVVGSARGIMTFEIRVEHNLSDLHSGNFGGLARSATGDLVQLLSEMVDPSGKCLIPGFYDNVLPPTPREKQALKVLEPYYEELIKEKGLTSAPIIEGKDHLLQNQFLPTFNINGLQAGGVGSKRRTIIPRTAIASIDCRLVPDQDASQVKKAILGFITAWGEKQGIKDSVRVEFESPMLPIKSSLETSYFELVVKAVKRGFNKEPIIVPRLGGSLPLYIFDKALNKPVILVPYALPDENNHAPNENLDLEFFKNGVATTVELLGLLTSREREN